MGKKLCLINVDFKDVYDPKTIYKAGQKEVFTDERIAEIRTVNPDFVTIMAVVEEPEKEEK